MTDSRYAPPSASVTDVESIPASLERPPVVKLAIRLLWAGIAVGIPGVAQRISYLWGRISSEENSWTLVVALILLCAFFALGVLLTWKSWQGRNWARLVYLAMMIASILLLLGGYVLSYALRPATFIQSQATWGNGVLLVRSLLVVTGTALLFSPAANTWFRAMKSARR